MALVWSSSCREERREGRALRAADASEVAIGERGPVFCWRGAATGAQSARQVQHHQRGGCSHDGRELGHQLGSHPPGLASVPPVRGRFEAVDEGQPFAVLVDFAHTPVALGEALRAARGLTVTARVRRQACVGGLLVFGAGGDRDRAKRPLMGKVAAELPTWWSSRRTTPAMNGR